MRLETLPLLLGGLVGVFGLLLVLDAWLKDDLIPEERRRTPRIPRDRGGEALVGLGTIAMAAAFVGRDTWRWGTIAVIAGSLLFLIGALRNRSYLRQLFSRADWRRARPAPEVVEPPPLVTPATFPEASRRIR